MADIKTLLGDAYQEGMTLDEVNEALAAKDFVDRSVLNEYVPKSTADKYATEAAEYKKKLRATLTEAEQAAQAEKEKQDAKDARLQQLERTVSISSLKDKYIDLKYDSDTANKIAEATFDGDMDTVFDLQKKFLDNQQKSIRAEIMKNTPGASSGNQVEIDFTKQIQEAQAAGDFLTVSALLRQQAASNKK